MTATMYEILPAERAWSADAERLAQALVDGVEHRGRPSPDERAALSILFRDAALTFARADFRGYLRNELGEISVRWMYLATTVLSGAYVTNPRDRALILLACSLAVEQMRVPLGALLAQLDEPARQVVLDAVAIACQVTR